MIISDLQYIESADNSEVQGGFFGSFTSAFADANAEALAFGDDTFASTNTATVANSDSGFSGSASSSTASASSSNFFFKKYW